ERVDVCICTYQRRAVADAVRSVALQRGLDAVAVRVVVADNAVEPWARELVSRTGLETGLDIHYVHAPANNIAVARNACLDAAGGDWIAFLDDDEIASPGWLAALLADARSGEWDAVLGPVRAIYPAQAPQWVRGADLH